MLCYICNQRIEDLEYSVHWIDQIREYLTHEECIPGFLDDPQPLEYYAARKWKRK